jgi:hypothetical protein
MEITIFDKQYSSFDSIAHFRYFYYNLHLTYLASDFLEVGLLPKQISDAVTRSINVGRTARLDLNQHFRPVFSATEKEIIGDCKLSHLDYGLVLMNADIQFSIVGDSQISVHRQYLGSR